MARLENGAGLIQVGFPADDAAVWPLISGTSGNRQNTISVLHIKYVLLHLLLHWTWVLSIENHIYHIVLTGVVRLKLYGSQTHFFHLIVFSAEFHPLAGVAFRIIFNTTWNDGSGKSVTRTVQNTFTQLMYKKSNKIQREEITNNIESNKIW